MFNKCSNSKGSVHEIVVPSPFIRMRYVAAYLLAVLGGNNSPSSKDIKSILGSVGIEADDERLDKVSKLEAFNQIFLPR